MKTQCLTQKPARPRPALAFTIRDLLACLSAVLLLLSVDAGFTTVRNLGDPLADVTVLEHVRFVMKNGVVWKDVR